MDFNEMQSINTNDNPDAPKDSDKESMSLTVKFAIVFVLLLILAGGGAGGYYYNESQKEYIAGNVFNFGLLSSADLNSFVMGFYWRTSDVRGSLLYRGLLETDSSFTSFTPDIAESYEILENGLVYKFKIKDNEFWSDGTPITAEDVEFTYKVGLLIRPAELNPNFAISLLRIKGAEEFRKPYLDVYLAYDKIRAAQNLLKVAETNLAKVNEGQENFEALQDAVKKEQANLAKAQADNPGVEAKYEALKNSDYLKNTPLEGIKVEGNTITVTLEKSYQPMLNSLFTQVVIYPKHCLKNADTFYFAEDNFWKNPVTSGMYKYAGVVDGKYVSLPRNEHYTGKKPKIDEVRYIFGRPQELDFSTTSDVSQMVNLSSVRDLRKYDVNVLVYRYFVFNLRNFSGSVNETMEDIHLRRAITYSIDRQRIFYDIYFNAGTVNNSAIIDTDPAYNGFAYEYNPTKAKELIKESGYDLNRPLRLAFYHQDQLTRYFLNAVKNDLENIGFTVELILTTNAEMFRQVILTVGGSDFYLKAYPALFPLEWYNEFKSDGNLSLILGTNAYDDLIEELATTVDADRNVEILKELQSLEQERLEKFPLFTLNQAVYINESRVEVPHNVSFGNTFYMYDMNFEDWEIKKQ